MSATFVPDDRIFPVTKWISAVIVFVLVLAFIILYLFTDRTEEFFAWKITPPMTALLMGAGYLGGGYFFARVVFARRWHTIGHGFIPISLFVWFLAFTTVLHFDRFTPGHRAFYTWAFLYIVTPILIPYLWYRNRVTDPRTIDPGEVVVPQSVRYVAAALGIFLLCGAVILFTLPVFGADALNLWAWRVSPLTIRVIAGWCALTAAAGPVLAREPRWSAWKILVEGQVIALMLILFGAVRDWSDYRFGNFTTWFFLGLLSFLAIGNCILYITMEARRRKISVLSSEGVHS